jgi:hypothetical protein
VVPAVLLTVVPAVVVTALPTVLLTVLLTVRTSWPGLPGSRGRLRPRHLSMFSSPSTSGTRPQKLPVPGYPK